MPNSNQDQEELTIDQVAVPWYVRRRNWLIAGAVAGGLVALGQMRRNNLSRNPLRSKDPKYWLGPLSVGKEAPVPLDQTPAHLEGLWDAGRDVPLDSRALREMGVAVTDSILQLYQALGRPDRLPFSTFRKLAMVIHSADEPDWSANIINLKWLFEAAQKDSQLLRWVWYAVHVPQIAALSPEDQQHVFWITDNLAPKERWRVKWFYDASPRMARYMYLPKDAWPGALGYHHGYLTEPAQGGYTLEEALGLPYKTFLEKVEHRFPVTAAPKVELWLEAQEHEPKKRELQYLSTRAIVHFPKRDYLRAYRFLKSASYNLQEADIVRGAVGLAFTFGPDWKKWLIGMQKKGVDAHDATFWLPQEPAPGLGEFLKRRYLRSEGIRVQQVGQMNLIAGAWNSLPSVVKKDTTKNIVRYITSAQYEDVLDETFAEEAARWGVDPGEYKELERRWLKAVAKKSDLQVEAPGRRGCDGRSAAVQAGLRRPARVLFPGGGTRPAARLRGLEAESCAWFGVENPWSAFYAIEDPTGTVIAQSWAWRNADVVVYDNIEGPGVQSSETRDQVIAMYRNLANELIMADPTILEVRIGDTVDRREGGRRYIDWNAKLAEGDDIALVPPPFEFIAKSDDPYTDSSGRQFILARMGDGTQYFRTPMYMEALAHLLGGGVVGRRKSADTTTIRRSRR